VGRYRRQQAAPLDGFGEQGEMTCEVFVRWGELSVTGQEQAGEFGVKRMDLFDQLNTTDAW